MERDTNEPHSASRLLIVDGHAYAYRAFHAIRELTSPAGAPTNAIFGFIKSLAKMRATLQPTHLAVVWDGGLAEERLALLPDYKAQRPPMPAGLEAQLDGIVRYLQAAGIASHCQDGVEADDRIATLARHAVAAGCNAIVASSDKDFMQLVGPRIGLFNPNDKSETVWTGEQVRAKTGVEPEQIVDWLSLIGDSVDNIPGVPGIGPKTATALLTQFGSCDGLFARLSEVKSDRLRTSLGASAGAVRRNQQMIRLREDLPGEFNLQKLGAGEVNYPELRALYTGWGFKGLRQEVEAAQSGQRELL
jgi:DNA polymerase-1